MPRRLPAPYDEIVDDLRTGDLFFGRGTMMASRIIEFVTGGLWSHVGMIVEGKDMFPGAGDDMIYLWEATSIPGQDAHPDGPRLKKSGPMLVPLKPRVEQYIASGNYELMSVRYLQNPRAPELLEKMRTFMSDPAVREATYPDRRSIFWDWIRHRYLLQTRQQGTYYCSELIADTWIAMGLLPDRYHIQSYVPRDFTETGHVPLLGRSEMGEERHMSA